MMYFLADRKLHARDEEVIVDNVLRARAFEARLRSTGSCVATPTGRVSVS